MNAVESLTETPPAQFTPFGSLIDLIRLRAGASSAEVCDACNTINLGSTRYCKCCLHKLACFYVAKELGTVAASRWDELAVTRRASAVDLVAFFIVINSLVILTSWIPVG